VSPLDALVVEDLTVRYGAQVALSDAYARAPAGSFVCLVGLNGAGKSTLLRAIVGIVPSSGTVRVLGSHDGNRRRLIAYVPQREDLNWGFPISVLEVVLMGRPSAIRRIGFSLSSDRADAIEALQQVGLEELRSRAIGELSGGQQQRVILARALYAQAPVMLLDEPLSGVDPATRQLIQELLRRRCQEGTTVLMATHDVLGSSQMADRVWGINGSVVADIPATRLLDEDVLRRIYGDRLVVLPSGRVAVGDDAR
jgi:ABC-type Mn2+/Zn2+ transport system ATPase subunit